MGKNHFRLLRELPEFELTGVVEPSLTLQRERLADFPAVYASLDEVPTESYEAAVLATPIPTHFELGRRLLQQKKHLLIEKPLASTVDDCKELLNLARANQVVLTVGHVERYNPAFRAFAEQLQTLELGNLFRWEFHRLGPYPMNPGAFGVIGDLGVHDFDLFYQLTRQIPRWIFSQKTRQFHPTHEDGLTLMAGIESSEKEALALFNVNWLSPRKQRFIRVYGENGMLEANLFERQLRYYESKLRRQKADEFGIHGIEYGETVALEVLNEEPLKVELESFAQKIFNDEWKSDSEWGSLFAVAMAHQAEKTQGHRVFEKEMTFV